MAHWASGDFLRQHPEVTCVTVEFQTGALLDTCMETTPSISLSTCRTNLAGGSISCWWAQLVSIHAQSSN